MAFLLLPRAENNAVGYHRMAALPITGSPGITQALARVDSGPTADPPSTGPDAPASLYEGSKGGELQGAGDAPNSALETSGPGYSQAITLKDAVFPAAPTAANEDGVVMHVRSPVASYWRGQVFGAFDGIAWHPEGTPLSISEVGSVPGNLPRYVQTYFMRQAQPGPPFMGYRVVEVISSDGVSYGNLAGKGTSYKVVSVQPDLVPENLRQDRAGEANLRYYSLPSSTEWLPELAARITRGAATSFDSAVSIVEFLRLNGKYDSAPSQLNSSTTLQDFLLERRAGTSIDFATATVMLARAAGLPARMAAGYLPGEPDPLSGAYTVRHQDAHAWAEIFFQEHGWVPFDGTPRPDLPTTARVTGGEQPASLKYLFDTSIGDDLLRAMVVAPSRLPDGFKDSFDNPISTGLAVVAAGATIVGLGWLSARLLWKGRRRADRRLAYSRLSGSGRDEMLRVYGRVEKLLRKKGIQNRKPGQTLREYTSMAWSRPAK